LGINDNLSTHRLPAPPVERISSQTARLIAIRVCETTPCFPDRIPPYVVRPERVSFLPAAMHEGHWNPTAASRMQSGQIGRSHRWHRM